MLRPSTYTIIISVGYQSWGHYGSKVMPTGRPRVSSAASARLAPPWAAAVALTALLSGSGLAALVWHATRLDPADAWILRWQELAFTQAGGLAAIVSATLKPVVLLTMVAGAVIGWRVKRRDLIVLALVALPATFAVEFLLKRLVHRQWEGDPALLFPSGHAAMATAVALTAVLAFRVAPVGHRARLAVACLTVAYVLAIAVARLVETVHPLTDVLGGIALGLVVPLGAALALTAMFGCEPPDQASAAPDR
jgi:membrane-associated phospholipid phosphatase